MAFGSLIQDERQERKVKSLFLSAIISVFLFLLIIRLFYLQVIMAELNLRLSNENAMREKLLIPPRGQIFDRNGVVLARNRPSYSICVLPYKVRDKKKTINSLCMIKDSMGNAVFDSTDLMKIW
jgi:penicillin-binding protein 2